MMKTVSIGFEDKWLEYVGLIGQIIYQDHLYYGLDEIVLSDREYDNLIVRLKNIEKEYPWFPKVDLTSPTQKVGHDRFKGLFNE